MKLQIGQDIYLKPIGNAARRTSEIKEGKITKIGKKYFEVDAYSGRFFIDDLYHDAGEYTSNYRAYFTKQEILDEMEAEKLFAKISTHFRYRNPFTIDQLKAIDKIITP